MRRGKPFLRCKRPAAPCADDFSPRGAAFAVINPYLPPRASGDDSPEGADPMSPKPEARRHALPAVQLVQEAFSLALRDPTLVEDGNIDAAAICRVVLELAADRFGAQGKQVLMDWNIARSEDVGLIAYRLIEAGIMDKSEEAAMEDFDGLFDLAVPPDQWQLRWQ
jgi:uncharacterized repeat protein (TIGR04138 family)